MEMEQPLREIIQVELMYDDGTTNLMFLDAFHIDTQELLELKDEGLAQILQRASAHLSGHKVLRMAYKDDEADWCTFNKASLRDALIFASSVQVNDCGILHLRITTDRTPLAGAAAAGLEPPAPLPGLAQALAGEAGQQEALMLEVHVNVVCDGCNANPLMGKRFKSLEHENFDLCETCFHREPRVPNRWVRVQSDQLQKVAACSGPEASAHATWVVQCDQCGSVPIQGPRFRCLDLPDYDLCSSCYSKTLSQPGVGLRFVQMDDPSTCLGKQPKPNLDEVEDLESQRMGGDGQDEKTQSMQHLGEIAEELKAIEELEAQRSQVLDKRAKKGSELKAMLELEFSKVSPSLEAARSALMGLRSSTLQDIAALPQPAEALRLPLEAAVIMVKPDLGMPPPWAHVRKALRDPAFLPSLVDFQGGSMKESTRQFIRSRYLEHRLWNEHTIAKASKAALPFVRFVESQMEFADVLVRLEPALAEARRLEAQVDEAAKTIGNFAEEEQTQEVPEPVDLEDPPPPPPAAPLAAAPPAAEEEHGRVPDLEAVGEASLRVAMASLLADAEPSIRGAAAKALREALEGTPDMVQTPEAKGESQEREADTTSTDGTSASTSGGGMVSTTSACSPTSTCAGGLSARVVSAPPLVLGIEAEEAEGLRGDATEEKGPELLSGPEGSRQIFRMGHILVPTGSDIPAVPACAKLVIVNDGTVPWPDTAAVVHVSGDDMDFHSMQLGSIEPGGGCEVSVELLVPPSTEPKSACSTWAVLDEASGVGLGPMLLFEVQWTEQPAA